MHPRLIVTLGSLLLTMTVASRGHAQTTMDRGAFLMTIGNDTIVLERFARAPDTVQGSITIKGQPRQDYVATLGDDFTITGLSLAVFRGTAADAAPVQRVVVSVEGDSIFAAINGAVQRFGHAAGAVVLLNNSMALAEQFTRRARGVGGSVTIPAWAVSGGIILTVTLHPVGADSMTLVIGGTEERLRVDAVGRILGGIIPAQHVSIHRVDPSVAATLALGKADYSPPAGAPYTATDVTITGQGGIHLGGTLTLPTGVTGPVPAVVTITGSGQQDRDEYIPLVSGYRPFRQIADTLGRRGIAVLRLDDRMVGESGGAIGTSADYAEDVRAALAYLRTRPEIDGNRLGLIGHSEGGMIAPMVAATDSRLRGIVLMAGPAERGLDIIHFQQRNAVANDSSVPPSARDSVLRLAATTLDSLGRTNPWLGFFLQHDPLAVARQVKVPTLILQGATDHQVTPEQAEQLAGALKQGGNLDVTVHRFPGLNHLFVPDSIGQPSGYAALKDGRVAPAVLGTLADWLVDRLGRKR